MEALGENWRRDLIILPQTEIYLQAAREPFSDSRIEFVSERGSELVKAAGGFVEAGKQIQEIRMRALRPNLEFIEEYGYLYPAIHDPVCEIFTTGANPLLKAVFPANNDKDEKPHDEKLTPMILQTLWEDVQDGSLFLCHRKSIPSSEFIAASSTGAVPKKNPDRTISAKVRIISDLRRINLSLKKTEVFPVMTPSIEKICTKITLLKRLFPEVEIEMAKRDIARAFKLIPVPPQLMAVLYHPFSAQESKTTSDLIGGYLSLPFGWVASPGFFHLVTEIIQEIHRSFGPSNSSWNSPDAYQAFLYVGDAMFIEPRIGSRPEDSISTWEWACKGVLADRIIHEEKAKTEGYLSTKHTLLGFDIDTETGIIEVPPVKVMGARIMILSDVYRPGSSKVKVRDIQVLRGLCQHWLSASLYWKLTLQGLDTILRFADEADDYISCPEPDVWVAYWNVLEVLRVTADDELRWNRLFRGRICQVVEVSKRFSGPRQVEQSEWITSDATLQQTASVNWHMREFLTATVDDVMKVFSGYRSNQTIIAEAELGIEILGCVLWGQIEGDRLVQFLGGDNANSYFWIQNGKARKGVVREMIAGFQLWIAHYGLEPIPFFLRTHRNITSDFLTRASPSQITEWAKERNFTKTAIPWWWEKFGGISNLFKWEGKLPETIRYIVPGDAPRLTLVEWGGAGFTPLSIWGLMGQTGFSWKARTKKGEELLQAWRIKIWNEEPVHVLAGTAWSADSILDFQHDIGRARPKIALLMTPSEVESPPDAPLLWDTHLWLDGTKMGDVVAGCWNLYIRGSKSLGELINPIATESAMTIQQAFLRVDLKPQSVERLSTRVVKIEHSMGYLRFQGGTGKERLSQQSQHSPLSFVQSRLEWVNWPLVENGAEPNSRDYARGTFSCVGST